MGIWRHQLFGPTDPAADAGWTAQEPRKGFFTDTSICIGCKACEVACKEWNRVPMHGTELLGSSYDNTGHLGADVWRHVAFIEQGAERIRTAERSASTWLGMPGRRTAPGRAAGEQPDKADSPLSPAAESLPDDAAERAITAANEGLVPDFRWLISSDVCKHCTHAGCLDVCPTGALFRTEYGTVVVQPEVCNGCGYCVASCPFGVIGRRERPDGDEGSARGRVSADDKVSPDGKISPDGKVPNIGVAQKCTLCYDRISHGQLPACAQTCPTTSIKFGDRAEMLRLARQRLATLHANGHPEARLYGANDNDGVGGTGSVFLLLDEPEVYGLPPDPVVPTRDVGAMFTRAGIAGTAMIAVFAAAFVGVRR